MSTDVVVAPVPDWDRGVTVIEPPGEGPGNWAGAPSVAVDGDWIYLAYRLRRPIAAGRGFGNVIARSRDGVSFETLGVVEKDRFGAESLERPALVARPGGGWRLYVSCAQPGTKHWWIEALDADDPAELVDAPSRVVLPGDAATAVKDPVVRCSEDGWEMWVCCHPTAVATEADRMDSRYATSGDGLEWTVHGVALSPRPGAWDARGARVTSVLGSGAHRVAYYDGRATAQENWEERTGLARGTAEFLLADEAGPAAESPSLAGGLRYLDVLELPDGGMRLYYEATRLDGSHELRSELVAGPPTLPA